MVETNDAGGDVRFLDYLRPLWRFKFIVILVVALAAAGTYFLVRRQTKVYATSTAVYVGQSALALGLNPNAASIQKNTLADEASFVTTPAVAQAVKANLKLPYSPDALLAAVSVTPAKAADFLVITAQTGKPQLAADLANGFAQAYLALSRGNFITLAKQALKADERKLAALPSGTKGNTTSTASERLALGAQISTLSSDIASPPSGGSQPSPAAVPGAPISPKPTRDAVFAGALALVLGIILSYLFDRRDRRIRHLSDLEALFDVPVLASVPHVRRAEPAADDLHGIPKALREPLRTLRVNLEVARGLRGPKMTKVILVTSALPSEGKSMIVRNLAITYRQAGASVAVVEADLRRPVLAARFGVDQAPGLGEALARDEKPGMKKVPGGPDELNGAAGRLDVLVAGTVSEDPTVLLTGERLERMLVSLSAGYDLVLLDAPPVLVVGDALPLLSIVDGVVIVARAGTITYPAVARLRDTIERVSRIKRVNVLGIVANEAVDELSSYYRPYAKTAPTKAAKAPASETPTPEPAAS